MVFQMDMIIFAMVWLFGGLMLAIGIKMKWGLLMVFAGLLVLAVLLPVDQIVMSRTQQFDDVTVSTVTSPSVTNSTIYYDVADSSSTSTLNGALAGAIRTNAEKVGASCSLVGKKINTLYVDMFKGGNPTGSYDIGVFDSTNTLKTRFANGDPSTLTTTATRTKFSFSDYTIASGDYIGVRYTGGDASNYVASKIRTPDAMGGTNCVLSQYSTSWADATTYDMTFTLTYETATPSTTTATHTGAWHEKLNLYNITFPLRLMIVLFGAIILLFAGISVKMAP